MGGHGVRTTSTAVMRSAILDQYAITHGLHQSAMMIRYLWFEDFVEVGLESGARPFLIDLTQSPIADHVGNQNRGKTALGAFFSHAVQMLSIAAGEGIVGGPGYQVYPAPWPPGRRPIDLLFQASSLCERNWRSLFRPPCLRSLTIHSRKGPRLRGGTLIA
jgi:hypothetical protein